MIILDTQALLWAAEDSPRLGPVARATIASSFPRYVSAISHAELSIKSMRGKLKIRPDLAEQLAGAGFEPLPLHERHIAGLWPLTDLVRHDPFDRLLLAQAHVDGLTLVTSDRVLLDFHGTLDATS